MLLTLVILCDIFKFDLFGPVIDDAIQPLPVVDVKAAANVDEVVESFDAFDICDEFIIELIMSAAVS